MPRTLTATAWAPSSVGNVAVGFDILGHSIAAAGDRVTARRSAAVGVRIVAIRGVVVELPREAQRNTAGAAVLALLADQRPGFGVDLEIDKGIALGSGMGGSAASAVAALVAVNALLPQPLAQIALYRYALLGEQVASGGSHGDNVGPQLLGGLVLATRDRLVPIPVAPGLSCALVHPHLVVETRRARECLQAPYAIGEFVAQSAHLAQLLAGCYRNEMDLIRAGLNDVLVEPRRAALIPGFAQVKQAALDGGALGASISGAGPSVFAWFTDAVAAAAAANAMRGAFADAGLASDVFVGAVAGPAARLESCAT